MKPVENGWPGEKGRDRDPWSSPPGTKTDDQARSKTVTEAIGDGASRVVVGRPVLRASKPEEVLDLILEGKG